MARCRMKQLASVIEMGEGQGQARMAVFPSQTTWRPNERIPITQTYKPRVMKRAIHNFVFPITDIKQVTKSLTMSLSQALKHIKGYPRSTKVKAKKIVIYFGSGRHDGAETELKKQISEVVRKGVQIFTVYLSTSEFAVRNYIQNFGILVNHDLQRLISVDNTRFTTMIEKHLLQNCEACKAPALDIVFLVDYTMDKLTDNFNMIIAMIKRTVGKYVIGLEDHQARVGVLAYGHGVFPADSIKIDKYSDRWSLFRAMDKIRPYSTADRNHPEAMKHAIENELKTSKQGYDLYKIMVIISDGVLSKKYDTDGQKALEWGNIARVNNKIQTFFVAINKGPSVSFETISGRPDHVIAYADFSANYLRIADELSRKICLSTLKIHDKK